MAESDSSDDESEWCARCGLGRGTCINGDCLQLLELVRANPGESKNAILSRVVMRRARANDILSALIRQGLVVTEPGPDRSLTCRIGEARGR